jgi:hypothetical protein
LLRLAGNLCFDLATVEMFHTGTIVVLQRCCHIEEKCLSNIVYIRNVTKTQQNTGLKSSPKR